MNAEGRKRKSRLARKRTYNTRLIKRDYPYFVSELAELFCLHPNAIRRWIKAGLRTVDDRRPVLVHGGDLIDFLNWKQTQRRQKCAADEFYCCRCRRPQKPQFNRVELRIRNEAKLSLSSLCGICGTRINRAGSMAKIAEYHEVFIIETPGEGRISGRSDPAVMCHLNEDKIRAALQSKK